MTYSIKVAAVGVLTLSIFISVFMISVAVASAKISETIISPSEKTKSVQLLTDRSLINGLEVKNPALTRTEIGGTHTVNGTECPLYSEKWSGKTHELNFANQEDNKEAKWTLAQWGSKANIWAHHGKALNAGAFSWENWYKKLTIGKPGSGYRFVTLGINGSREYKGVWGGEQNDCFETPHPHLLIEQKLDISEKPSVGEMDKLLFSLTSKLTKSYLSPAREKVWEQNTATAHFVTHIDFQNLRADKDFSKGHGQSFAIGINFYDARDDDKYFAKRVFIHKPRQRAILYIPVEELAPGIRESLAIGQWSGFKNADIMPYIKEAFAAAIDEGKTNDSVTTLLSEDLNDYYVAAARYGWEVSSLHDVEMHVSDFSLTAITTE